MSQSRLKKLFLQKIVPYSLFIFFIVLIFFAISRKIESLNDMNARNFMPVHEKYMAAKNSLKSNPEKAVEDLKILTKKYPEFPETYGLLAKYFFEKKDPEAALSYLQSGLENSPDSRKLKFQTGRLLFNLKKYAQSRQIFEELNEEFPKNTSVLFYLARSCFALKDYELAARIYSKILEIRPEKSRAYINLGITEVKLHFPEKALENYQKALKIQDNDAVACYNLGLWYSKNGDTAAALNWYKKAVSIKKGYAKACYNMAIIYHEMNDSKNAEKNYINAIDADKAYVKAYLNLADLYQKQESFGKARALLQKAVEISEDFRLSNKLAQVYELNNEEEQAMELYGQILEKDPENPETLMNLSQLHQRQKNYGVSRYYIEKYISLFPEKPLARYILMVNEYNGRDFREAWQQWEVLDRIAPDFQDMKGYREKIFSRLNQEQFAF